MGRNSTEALGSLALSDNSLHTLTQADITVGIEALESCKIIHWPWWNDSTWGGMRNLASKRNDITEMKLGRGGHASWLLSCRGSSNMARQWFYKRSDSKL
jgi:hypothetical protein